MSSAADSRDVSRHAGQVVRRVLIRRNIAVGKEVVAFVWPRLDAAVTAAELTQYARQHLAAQQVPAADHDRARGPADQRGQARPQEAPHLDRLMSRRPTAAGEMGELTHASNPGSDAPYA